MSHIDETEKLIRDNIAAGNMDHQPAGDTAKHLCGIIDALRLALTAAKDELADALSRMKSYSSDVEVKLRAAKDEAEKAKADTARLQAMFKESGAGVLAVIKTLEDRIHVLTHGEEKPSEFEWAGPVDGLYLRKK